MKNPNSPAGRFKKGLATRWSAEDYPGAEPRFQIPLFAKDVAVFVLLPVLAVLTVKAFESGSAAPRRPLIATGTDRSRLDAQKSQIISFVPIGKASGGAGAPRRSPGS